MWIIEPRSGRDRSDDVVHVHADAGQGAVGAGITVGDHVAVRRDDPVALAVRCGPPSEPTRSYPVTVEAVWATAEPRTCAAVWAGLAAAAAWAPTNRTSNAAPPVSAVTKARDTCNVLIAASSSRPPARP